MAITTTYGGIEYRSRLEARWAAFFNALGWHYTYEPFDGDGYIPDFLIHGDRPLLVEVKPAVREIDFEAPVGKAERGLRAHWNSDILVVGADPLPMLNNSWDEGCPAAGWLGEFYPGDEYVPGATWIWGVGNWFVCRECSQIGVFHDEMTYAGRPCGHYEGDHYLTPIQGDRIRHAWAGACNDVKWKGRSVETNVVPLNVVDHNALPPKRLA